MTTSVVHVLRARRVSLGSAPLSDAARMFPRYSSIHGLAAQLEKAKQHLLDKHPDLANVYEREHILFMAH